MSAPGFACPKAIACFRLLQLHPEQDIPLARIAAEGGIAERTLRRWLAVWRAKGIAGLERSRRSDAGIARRLAPEIDPPDPRQPSACRTPARPDAADHGSQHRQGVTLEVVEAARDRLVIGPGD